MLLSIVTSTRLFLITRRSRSQPSRSVVPIRLDVPANRDVIASRDSRREGDASTTQRAHAPALLVEERSPARASRSGTPQEIARWNRPPPSDRKDFSLVPESQQRPARRQESQGLATRRCSYTREYSTKLFAAKSIFFCPQSPRDVGGSLYVLNSVKERGSHGAFTSPRDVDEWSEREQRHRRQSRDG